MADDAAEMAALLKDRALYRWTGNETPPDEAELRRRYVAQVAGPRPPWTDRWLNWIVRCEGRAVGYVQATVMGSTAEIAWVIGRAHQGRGYATEAARTMVEALRAEGIDVFRANIHPHNVASQVVAERLGMVKLPGHPFDGEDVWQS